MRTGPVTTAHGAIGEIILRSFAEIETHRDLIPAPKNSTEHVKNALQLKFDLLRMCASKIFGYWASSMPPEQTGLGAATTSHPIRDPSRPLPRPDSRVLLYVTM